MTDLKYHVIWVTKYPVQDSAGRYIKGRSSRLLQQEFPALRKRYWSQHLWARDYYCATEP